MITITTNQNGRLKWNRLQVISLLYKLSERIANARKSLQPAEVELADQGWEQVYAVLNSLIDAAWQLDASANLTKNFKIFRAIHESDKATLDTLLTQLKKMRDSIECHKERVLSSPAYNTSAAHDILEGHSNQIDNHLSKVDECLEEWFGAETGSKCHPA